MSERDLLAAYPGAGRWSGATGPRGALVAVSAFPAAGGGSSFASRPRGGGRGWRRPAVTLLGTDAFWADGLPGCGGGGAGGGWPGVGF